MAWEQRYHQRYYTRSQRVAGRTKRTYIGKGVEAKLAEALDLQKRAERKAKVDAERAVLAKMQAIADMTRGFACHVAILSEATLLAAGFHQHARGQWRKRRFHSCPKSVGEQPPVTEDLVELVALAKLANQAAIFRLKEILGTQAELWQHATNMAAQSREALIADACGTNLAAAELTRWEVQRLQADLAAESALPIIKVLAEACALCRTQLQWAEVTLASVPSKQVGSAAQKKLSTIHYRYVKVLKSLATVQRLLLRADDKRYVAVPTATVQPVTSAPAPITLAG